MNPTARPLTSVQPPAVKPQNPNFSSGPCAKRPGWSTEVLSNAFLGRSHRAREGKARLAEVIELSKRLLGLPEGWRLAIVPASDTGAIEMALWNLLGPRGVDMLAWESFGSAWVTDVVKQLKLSDVRVLKADYGSLPDLSAVDGERDLVFTWNGTTSGVRLPDGDWIPDGPGLKICDATSAVFAMDLPYDRLDVVTWSWQKVMGGEAAHGMLALSPRAVERMESYQPEWPMPKIFRLSKGGKLDEAVFEGATINTPSMLCVEDQLDSLRWGVEIGGLPALKARAEANLSAVARWVSTSDWADFLATEPSQRSCTSICIKIVSPWFAALSEKEQASVPKKIAALLEAEGVAYDINGYRDAPPGLRLWGGATVDSGDMTRLLPWLDWAYAAVKGEMSA
ncbi:phosphoserine transaminase [Limibacillus halophilus]|uniref:phosphoserine transaminase n=1 Tax=Limibacillus halophilus TaxID=1579333 RepID=A0A839SPP5_9PROT|nr:phosphoserine transaminase [Limibacillus halophilus]MBB3064781.1 phosphoserine aminotransferase [Limibacillus halophilus]